MNHLKCTPNLVVSDVARSLAFYRDVLGFDPGFTVPDEAPYVFGSVTKGMVEIFFNDQKAVAEDMPTLAGKPIGGTMTLYIETEGVEALHDRLAAKGVRIVAPLKTQFYGMREFTITDPDGWLVMFAQRVG
ncbi:MAG: VOC family protein [Acidobacteriales bacterium]|nr:VOC family protein [Terriglobales bacterium]